MRESHASEAARRVPAHGGKLAVVALVGVAMALAGCAAGPSQTRTANGRVWDPKLGVWSSPRLVADGDAVPRGGGSYLTGRPYTIGGRMYVPNQNPGGYSAVGTASWYGDAFHGRRTANGEVFDKGSISAAHPTLPLPSYCRVTNLKNGRSMVVRVNDRGPYHGGRVMDVSQRVAEALQFRGEGTARVRVDYLGRAALQGSDDGKLMASLRTDGGLAQIDGMASGDAVALAEGVSPGPVPLPRPVPQRPETAGDEVQPQVAPAIQSARPVPLPPPRPFTLGRADAEPAGLAPHARTDGVSVLLARSSKPLNFAADTGLASSLGDGPFGHLPLRDAVPLDPAR